MRFLLPFLVLIPLAGAVETTPPAPVPVQAQPQTQAQPQPQPITAARLIPGDLVRIEVFDNPDLSQSIRVPALGAAPFPLIGSIDNLAGRDTTAVSEELRRRLEDGYLRHAEVTVTVLEFAPRTAYVMGSVGRPGPVALASAGRTTALQAVGEAGGFSEDTDLHRIQLLHADGSPATLGDTAAQAVLVPGDVVVVARYDRVYVLGRVQRPGPINLPSNEPISVSKAISLAGGFERFAKDGSVQLLRGDGTPVTVDVRAVLDGKRDVVDPVLKPGETVFVPQSRF